MNSPNKPPLETGVHIAAAGQGSRLRSTMDAMGLPPNYPKHLLPTDSSGQETLLGRIWTQANQALGGEPVIYANPENVSIIEEHPELSSANIRLDKHDNWLELFARRMVDSNSQVRGCSGDYYADFTWAAMMAEHQDSGRPISVLAAQTAAVEGGFVYSIEDSGQVASFERSAHTSEEDLINIGVYIFDPQKDVLKIFKEMLVAREIPSPEAVFEKFVTKGLVGAYCVSVAFNINTPKAYDALLAHNDKPPVAVEEAA